MHHHKNNNSAGGHDSKMMWLMMLACLLPIFILSFAGTRGNGPWWIIGAVVGMLVLHWFMRQSHSSHRHQDNAGTSAVDDQPVVVLPPAKVITAHRRRIESTARDEHKHGCC